MLASQIRSLLHQWERLFVSPGPEKCVGFVVQPIPLHFGEND
jgi:hypothetical protein